jgi:hypothetical protein
MVAFRKASQRYHAVRALLPLELTVDTSTVTHKKAPKAKAPKKEPFLIVPEPELGVYIAPAEEDETDE